MSRYAPVLGKGLIRNLKPYWSKITKAAAKSLGRSPRGFIPPIEEDEHVLGCGAWGCVWPTKDPKFVLKASLDANEGGVISHVMSSKRLRFHPGVVYYRALWELPELAWVDHLGLTPVWIILREEADCDRCWTPRGEPARGLKKVYNALEKLPDIGDSLTAKCCEKEWDPDSSSVADGCDRAEIKYIRLLSKLEDTPGEYVGKFILAAWNQKSLILGDVHFGNVGFRRHDLSKFGVPRHNKLVTIDVGDQAQPTPDESMYPKVKVLR